MCRNVDQTCCVGVLLLLLLRPFVLAGVFSFFFFCACACVCWDDGKRLGGRGRDVAEWIDSVREDGGDNVSEVLALVGVYPCGATVIPLIHVHRRSMVTSTEYRCRLTQYGRFSTSNIFSLPLSTSHTQYPSHLSPL